MLEVGEVARDLGQVLADALGHFEIVVDVLVGRLGPSLDDVDERTIGGALVRRAAATERFDPSSMKSRLSCADSIASSNSL